ncbi:ACP S-malonyltransferase [Desulfocurvus sp. DL9XJH121]
MNANPALCAILFPGQGSQVKNMGRALAEADEDAMYWWTRAEAVSKQPLREIYWGGDDQDMAETSALQPALTVACLNLWMYAEKRIKAAAFAGHSLGEYPALAAARVLTVDEVLDIVSLRGRLMSQAAGEGQGMSALLKLGREDAEAVVEAAREQTGAPLIVANYNTPSQFVISGRREALDAAAELVREKKGRAIPLPVSGAFHSPLIQEAADELAVRLDKADWREPKGDVYFNATAAPERDPKAIHKLMRRQMTSPVRWTEINAALYASGVRTFHEVGPKNVLAKMLGQNLKDMGDDWVGGCLDGTEAVDQSAEA